jgi:cell division protein FtsI/penicillin-binding protein 2
MADSNNGRINFLLAVFFLLSVGIMGRMFYWQIVKHSVYIALAEGQRVFLSALFPERGEIFINDKASSGFSGGAIPYFPVAINRTGYSVYAVPAKVKNISAASENLAKALGMETEEVKARLAKTGSRYEVIARKISEEKMAEIKSLKISGIEFEPENWRYWPERDFLAQVLGFVGFSGDKREGQYGVEGYFNGGLEGKTGFIEAERDTGGGLISLGMKQYQPAQNGSDIVLTIDRAIQYQAEKEVSLAAEKLQPENAQAIVMEPSTGKILAMVNWPKFDLNNYSAVKNYGIFLNRNIQSRYEPGSVIKPFTIAAAINEGKITPNTVYEDKGALNIDGWQVRNADNKIYGVQTITGVLEKSINTGAIFAASQIDKDTFQAYFKNFGFDIPTGIELQGEMGGDLSNLDTKRDIVFANASFGQGIAVTPLEITAAFGSLINGGKLMKPYIVDKIIKYDGTIEQTRPESTREVISSETSAKITGMLVQVVESGHSKSEAIKGFWIGGKTGTAQMPFPDKRGYSDKTSHTFLGFGSAPDPKFLIFVKMDDPKGVKYAESSVAPVFYNIANFLVNYLGIPPNRK